MKIRMAHLTIAVFFLSLTGLALESCKNKKKDEVTVAPPPPAPPIVTPPPAPVVIAPDDPLTHSVADATKDFPTVKASVKDGVVTLTGDIKKADLKKLIMGLHALHPKKIDNQLTVK